MDSPPGTPTTPALTAAEWRGVIERREHLAAIREQLLDTPFSSHAVAALLLYEQPFGFSAQDVEDETQVAAYCDAMAAEGKANGNEGVSTTFQLLARRHRERAAKIAGLLPPV